MALLLFPARSAYTSVSSGRSAGVILGVMEKLTPTLTEAPVMFSVRQDYGQEAMSQPGGEDLGAVSAWQIQILDESGRKVSYIQGRNAPPSAAIPWTGISDNGVPLADGFYKARFMWMSSDKQVHATETVSVYLFAPAQLRSLSEKKLRLDYTDQGLVLTFTESMIFKPGESRIKKEAFPALQEIALILKSYPDNKVLVLGHSDSSGSARKNFELSRARAAGVCRYLEENEIPPSRLMHKGLGSAKPVASNGTQEGRSRNRRVEVVILKADG